MKNWHWFAIVESFKGKYKMMKADFFFDKREPQTAESQREDKPRAPKVQPSSSVIYLADYVESRKRA